MITKDEILDKYNIPEEKRESVKRIVRKETTAFLEQYAYAAGITIPEECSRITLENICLDNVLKSEQSFRQQIQKQHETKIKHAKRFQQIFKANINQYFIPLVGFDVISFDQNIAKPQDGESTIECLQRRFGTEAVNMIQELIC